MQGKATLAPNAPAHIHVGVDVCKHWLDVYFHPVSLKFRFSNDAPGLRQLKRELRKFAVIRIVMEATAKYHRLALRNLNDSGFCVALINPARARHFANAMGTLAKTDALDARVLALFSEGIAPGATTPSPQNLENLQELVGARHSAVDERTSLRNQRGAATLPFLRTAFERRITAIQKHIDRLEAEILRLIKTDPAMLRRVEILDSIPGVAMITAVAMVVGLAEMGSCTNSKIAMLAGLAPVACDSGDTSGQRHIRGGRAHVRCATYMAALAATQFNPDIKAFYKRLIANGKLKKVALTATMRKLVELANTLITDNRLWTPVRP